MRNWYNIADHRPAFKLAVMRRVMRAFKAGELRSLSHVIDALARWREEETEEGVRDAIQEIADGITRVAPAVCPQYADRDICGEVLGKILRFVYDALEYDSANTYNIHVEMEDFFKKDSVRIDMALLALKQVWRSDDEKKEGGNTETKTPPPPIENTKRLEVSASPTDDFLFLWKLFLFEVVAVFVVLFVLAANGKL